MTRRFSPLSSTGADTLASVNYNTLRAAVWTGAPAACTAALRCRSHLRILPQPSVELSNNLIFLLHLLTAGAILVAAARLGSLWLTAYILLCTVLMNIEVFKSLTLFGMDVTGGNVLFGTVLLGSDVLNEHYGRSVARRAVLVGFCGGLAVVVLSQFMLWYAPNQFDDAQPHLAHLFNAAAYPRVVVASMVSYLLCQLIDIRVYQLIRTRTGTSRLLWLRSNASTWLAQAFDTAFFTTAGLTNLAFLLGPWADTGGILQSPGQWTQAVAFAFLVKIAVAVVDTPFLYLTTWKPLLPADSRRHAI